MFGVDACVGFRSLLGILFGVIELPAWCKPNNVATTSDMRMQLGHKFGPLLLFVPLDYILQPAWPFTHPWVGIRRASQ